VPVILECRFRAARLSSPTRAYVAQRSGTEDRGADRPKFGILSEKSANLWSESIFWDICSRLIKQLLAQGHFLARRPAYGRFDTMQKCHKSASASKTLPQPSPMASANPHIPKLEPETKTLRFFFFATHFFRSRGDSPQRFMRMQCSGRVPAFYYFVMVRGDSPGTQIQDQ